MNFYEFLLLQIIAHILGDFIFQSEKNAEDKNKNGLESSWLRWHILIIFLTSWIFSLHFSFFLPALLIALTHWLFDCNKYKLYKIEYLKGKLFFIDQILHLIVIIVVVVIFSESYLLPAFFNKFYLILFLAYLLILKPANIFIKEMFALYNIHIPGDDGKTENELANAGKLIGDCERIITLTLILFNHIEVVGFIIAAKSILRYKETDTTKTEYVLIGSLLSFGIAIMIGFAVQSIK